MSIKSIFFILFIFATGSLNAQVEVKADGGSFEEFFPWGDGYLGIVQTQMYAFAPKYRQYQYFDQSGKMLWNEKITPFNFNNKNVCHNESEYAYFVNMPFSKTAVTEKTSKTELLNLYQVDKSGKVVTKAITYTSELKPVAAFQKDIDACYLGAYKDGIVFVATNDNKKFHVVKIDHAFMVSYQAVDFDWDEKLWETNLLSKVKFVLDEKGFSLIQMKHSGSQLVTTIKTIDLATFSDVKVVTNNLNISGYTLNSKSGHNIEYSTKERELTTHSRTAWKGNVLVYYPTLGSFTDFVATKNGLRMSAYFKNTKQGTNTELLKEGYLVYEISRDENVDIDPANEFVFKSDQNGSKEHVFYVMHDGEFVFISKQSRTSVELKTSTGEEKSFDGQMSFADVFLSYISKQTQKKKEAIDIVSTVGESYIGIDFEGVENSFGSTKRATIYQF